MEWSELKNMFDNQFVSVKEWLILEFSKINTGRVNPNMFNKLKVDAYGEKTPLLELANVSSVDARQLMIKPYDRSLIKEIAKALSKSEFHVNPQVNPENIRIVFAPLTRENRVESSKKAKQYLEQAKVKVRDVRQTVQSKYKKAENVSDDDIKYFENELNYITKQANKTLEEMFEKKQKDLMSL